MSISLEDYWMGRDVKYAAELTPEIRFNAEKLVGTVNNLLAMAETDGVLPTPDAETGSFVASGWRPVFVNDKTRNAASNSRHLTGAAVDLRDGRKRALARWCLKNRHVLELLGLWMEDPRWTPSWVHLQIQPPGSGLRVYVPSTMPPIAAALTEQGGTA